MTEKSETVVESFFKTFSGKDWCVKDTEDFGKIVSSYIDGQEHRWFTVIANKTSQKMVHSCSAYGCKEKFRKGGPYTFHCFPKDPLRRRQWVLKMRRKDFTPTPNNKICSKHFTEECYDREKFGATWLKPYAVPTVFNFPPHLLKNEKITKPPKENITHETPTNSNDKNLKFCIADEQPNSKKFRYLGDFQEEDMTSPSKALKVLFLAKRLQKKRRIEIQNLKNKLKRSQEQVLRLLNILQEMKDNSHTTDTSSSILETFIIP